MSKLTPVPTSPTRLRPADDVVLGLRRLADEIEAMEEQPKYLVTISALGDVRHYGPETHAGSSFEHLAMCVIIAQQWMHDLIRSFK